MSLNQPAELETAVRDVIRLEEELESPGHPATDSDALVRARAILHSWVEEITAAIVSPGLGRVTVMHPNGRASSISSPDLPFKMSPPITARPDR